MAESLAPPLHKAPGVQAVVVSTLLYGAEILDIRLIIFAQVQI